MSVTRRVLVEHARRDRPARARRAPRRARPRSAPAGPRPSGGCTEASLLRPTTSRSHAARACFSSETWPGCSRSKQPLVKPTFRPLRRQRATWSSAKRQRQHLASVRARRGRSSACDQLDRRHDRGADLADDDAGRDVGELAPHRRATRPRRAPRPTRPPPCRRRPRRHRPRAPRHEGVSRPVALDQDHAVLAAASPASRRSRGRP